MFLTACGTRPQRSLSFKAKNAVIAVIIAISEGIARYSWWGSAVGIGVIVGFGEGSGVDGIGVSVGAGVGSRVGSRVGTGVGSTVGGMKISLINCR